VWTLAVTLCKRNAEAGTENQQTAERNERTCLPRALKVRDGTRAPAPRRPARDRSTDDARSGKIKKTERSKNLACFCGVRHCSALFASVLKKFDICTHSTPRATESSTLLYNGTETRKRDGESPDRDGARRAQHMYGELAIQSNISTPIVYRLIFHERHAFRFFGRKRDVAHAQSHT
jgi:hypothetical protein